LRTAAVVLAAGKSQRMGRNKLLLEFSGRKVIDRLLDALDSSMVDEIYVVLGHRPEQLTARVGAYRAIPVINPDYKDGMTVSFKAGLGRVQGDAAFLVLGDQVGLDPVLLGRMVDALRSDPHALIVSPVHEGRRGHPVLFRRALFPEILGLGLDKTLRDVVDGHEEAHRLVEGDLWCTLDMDTPEDYERIRRLIEEGRVA
jgi:molybdenum cofactor cytidylyltransferase